MNLRFVPTALAGVVEVRAESHADDRGSFARTFCAREFAAAGLAIPWPETVRVVSPKDAAWPLLDPREPLP